MSLFSVSVFKVLFLVILQLFFTFSTAVDDNVTNCTNTFLSTFSNESESEVDRQVIYLSYGFYLFPLLKFHCNTNVTRILGHFLVNLEKHSYYSFYCQIWRPNDGAVDAINLVQQIELDFNAEYSKCQNTSYTHHVRCFINYTLPVAIEVKDHDFLGFYTSDNSLARPLFNETKSKTHLVMLSSRTNLDTINGRSEYMISSYPQIIVVTMTTMTTNDNPNPQAHIKQAIMQEKFVYAIISGIIGVIIMIMVIAIIVMVFKKKLKLAKRNSHLYHQLQAHDEAQQFTSVNNVQCDNHEEPNDNNDCHFKQPIGSITEISLWLSTLVPELSSDSIKVGSKIGLGRFGVVLHGEWNCDRKRTQVAIKTLCGKVSQEDKAKLLKEAAIIGQFNHINVVRLHGVITNKNLPVKMVMEYLSKGDLLSFLKSMRPKNNGASEINPQALIGYARDIAHGMNYLSNKHFIHRDLAARNVLLNEDNICKIADFGMARDFKDDDNFLSQDGVVPVKWTAIEALLYQKYSTASDVWSYGIVLYEMWSLGESPYRDHENKDVVDLLNEGYRLPPPPGCPQSVYKIMIQSWNPDAKVRPKFSALLKSFSQPSHMLLQWIEKDTQAGGLQCDALGAPLEAGQNLYPDLQKAYKSSYVYDL